ncbi:10588_t:CDS:1 [Gigaspora margarita]|uniref:10588_t:CDS:1 n=1 Tax=Gigaspora margarita TaxID=4874 RepID=A0ABN7WAI8_GIGMA|nr:10588_t:CDS:1 [Gigaspora margarita]
MSIITDGLSLASKKSIRDDFTNKIPELKKMLNSITGFDYEFIVDFSKIHADTIKAVPENNEWLTKSLGNIAFQYFDSLISKIKMITEKDDLVRSDFIKIINNREIHLLTDPDIQNYNEISILDGNIYIKARSSNYGTNVGGVGYNILDLLKSSDEVLPLNTKKNIRDSWEQQIPSLKKSLKQVLGEDYEFVIDWEDIYLKAISANEENESKIDWVTSRLGEIVYAYFESLIGHINNYAKKDDLVKSEFVNVIHTKKFYFIYDEDINDYNAIEVKDGKLCIKVKPETLGTNSSIGYLIIDVIKDPNDVLPLRTKKSIRDEWEKEIPGLKKQLNKCLGEDYQFKVDFNEVYVQIVKANENNIDWFSKSLGNVIFQYFSSLIKNIENYTKKDDLIRQEFLDLTSTRTFHLMVDNEVEDYHDVKIIDGGLYIMVHPEKFGTNASPGYDIVERLHAPDSVLPVITKVNIRDQWTIKIPALKKKLKDAVRDEIEFVVDFDNIFKIAKKNSDSNGKWYKNKLGEIVYGYFEPLVANIIKDDMVRDNFVEIVNTKKIYLIFDEEVTDYNDIIVKDGALYIRVGPNYLGTNSNNIGYNIIDVL